MRKSNWWTACLVLAVILTPLMFLFGPGAEQSVQGLAVRDDELVLLDGSGRIKVVDTNVPSGFEPVDWQSDTTGWTAVTLGDFNGDGDQEILATKGATAQIFDPVVQPGYAEVAGQWSISSPYVWYDMDTGDIDGDGRDEIVLLRSDAAGDILSRLLVYDGDAAGTSWTKTKELTHGARWDDVALGDVNADGKEDVGLIRPDDNLLLILNPAANWTNLHENAYNFTWKDLEMVNVEKTSGADKTEIALSRKGVLGELNSILVFRWKTGTALEDVWGGKFYPYFDDLEGADLNGDGDEELIMYRDTDDADITLIARNPLGSTMRTFEPTGTNSPHGGWLDLEAGDIDGDGRDEVILVRSSKYRVYDRPEASDNFNDVSGSFKGSFAVGNVDGDGVAAGPALGVSPTTLSFSFSGSNPPAQSVFVSNVGIGNEFSWTATVIQGASWLSISPTSGTTPRTLSVSVDATLLSAGIHQGRIQVDAASGIAGSPRYVDVTLNVVVTLPRLGVVPDTLTFTMDQGKTNPPDQYVMVENLGGGSALSWTATLDPAAPWLVHVVPSSSTTPEKTWIRVNGSGLQAGAYVGNVVFNAGSVLGSPFTLPVTLIVRPPTMQVSPQTLQFVAGCSPSTMSKTVTISQQGGGSDIQWMAFAVLPPEGGAAAIVAQAASAAPEVTAQGLTLGGELLAPVDWITITPDSGTTTGFMTVRANPSGLGDGWHYATIVIVGWPADVGNRVQAVDVGLLVADHCVFVPLIRK